MSSAAFIVGAIAAFLILSWFPVYWLLRKPEVPNITLCSQACAAVGLGKWTDGHYVDGHAQPPVCECKEKL
jgi:endogenous inhibitor of DNA gyrase (YacG/DUF329 family)